jgi:hypothetical protein
MYMMQAIENKPIFFTRMPEVFFDRTMPASSIAKPGAMNMTMAPMTRK